MADLTSTRSTFRGLIIPWAELSYDAAGSTITQAGPVPGHAVPQQATSLSLVTSGEMAASDALTVKVMVPGNAGRTDQSAHLGWKRDADALWYCWQPPHVLHAWEVVDVVVPGSTLQREYPALLTINAAGDVLLGYGVRNSSLGTISIRCKLRSASTGTWGSEVTIATTPTPTADIAYGPALCLLPSGRILAHYWQEHPTTGLMQIHMAYSDDSGATWTNGSRAVLPAGLTYEAASLTGTGYSHFGRISTAYSEVGQSVALFVHLRSADLTVGTTGMRDILVQYASATLGATCTQVVAQTTGSGLGGGWPSVVAAPGGGFVLAFVNGDRVAGSYEAAIYVLDTAWRAFNGTTEYTITAGYAAGIATANSTIDASGTGSYLSSGDLTLAVDPGGRLWLTHRCPSGSETTEDEQWVTALSTDGGVTWEYLGRSESRPEAGPWWEGWDEDTFPTRAACCWSQERLVVAHQWTADPGDEDNSIAVAYLGGWSPVTTPPLVTGTSSYQLAERSSYEHTWLAIEVPSDMVPGTGIGWTATGAGTAALTAGALNISTAAAAKYYTTSAAPTGTLAEGIEFVCDLSTVTSAHLTTAVYARVQLADGTNEYTVLVRFGQTTIRVIDVHGTAGAGTVVGDITVDVTAGVRLRVAIQDSTLVTYYSTSGTLSPLEWVAGPTATLTDASTYTAAAAGSSIEWGHAISTAESNWTEVHWSSDEFSGTGTANMTLPSDCSHHAAAGTVYVDGGLYVQALDGPGYIADEFDIATRYEYSRERLDPKLFPSPRHTWRTTGSDRAVQVTQQLHTWRVDDSITTASRPPASTIAFSVHNANWRTGSLRRRATAGAYTTVATFDAAAGLTGLGFLRAGVAVYGDPGNGSPPYFHQGELRGASIDLGSNTVRRIARNTAGFFGGNSGKRCVLYLEDIADTEPTSGASAAIWPSDFAVVAEIGTTDYRAVQLIIDAQYTADGYTEAGTIVVGSFEPFAFENSWGRVTETQARVETTVLRDGTERTRQAGPAARVVDLAWVDGVDLTGVSGVATYNNIIATSATGGSGAAGVVQETPIMLEDMIEELTQARTLAAYVPRLAKGDTGADTRVVNRREDGPILVRFPDAIRRESIQGTPNDASAGEVVRIAIVALQEIT